MNKLKVILLIATISLTISCDKNQSTTTGNPLISLSVTSSSQSAVVVLNHFIDRLLFALFPKAQALPPPGGLLDSQSNAVTLSDQWISIAEVEFEPTETADGAEIDGDEVAFVGPFVVDLFASQPENLGNAEIGHAGIKRIKMQLARVESLPVDAPADILNNSIFLSGTVNGNSFVFTSDDEVEFEVSGPNAINITSGSDLLLSFKVADLIKGIDLSSVTNGMIISQATPQSTIGSACPLIDSSANNLYTCFRKGIEQQADLGKDEDGSGELESDEESVD